VSRDGRYFRVGLFVVVGVALCVVAVLVLGGTAFLRSPTYFETYFDESVQGLEIGSPVKLRGVPVGSVALITFVGNEYTFASDEDRMKYSSKVLVRMKSISTGSDDQRLRPGPKGSEYDIQAFIRRGLRVRLAQQGITGTAYVEADFTSPDANPPMAVVWTPKYAYVPSAPSTLKSLSTAAERIFSKLEDAKLDEVVRHVDELILTATTTLDQTDMAGLSGDARLLLDQTRSTVASVHELVQSEDARALGGETRQLLEELRRTVADVQALVTAGGPNVEAALENLRVVTDDLRDAAANMRAYPSLFLMGEPPQRFKPGEAAK